MGVNVIVGVGVSVGVNVGVGVGVGTANSKVIRNSADVSRVLKIVNLTVTTPLGISLTSQHPNYKFHLDHLLGYHA